MATKAKRAKTKSKKAAKRASNGALKRWTAAEDKSLKTLIKQNTPTRVIGLKLTRTEGSVRQHVYKLGLSLKPTNRSPYG